MKGQRVLVTGASSGIGRELARQLAARGALVAIAARSEDRLRGAADEIEATGGSRPWILPVDLSRPGGADALAARALSEMGTVDALVNNAGTSLHGLQWIAGAGDEARELFETNYWSPLALTRALVPPMRERGTGTVVNVTSMIQVAPFPCLGHTCSSKAALAIASQALRMELEGSGVHVVEAPLGVIDTAGSYENRRLPGAERWMKGGPIGTADEAASRIVSAIENGDDRVIYPKRLAIGYALPGLARHYAARFARHAEPDESILRRTGSTGDSTQREARAEWEQRQASVS
ncbi:MAG TPA: SDR family NAD(P)-dependent oxidoreductase [Thermoleophilaceae bacterium]|nr:SDR family NAD(P)-dependent oxidoreductase [Thermoleophilaceae bacterium]